jgi:hypothetical protein
MTEIHPGSPECGQGHITLLIHLWLMSGMATCYSASAHCGNAQRCCASVITRAAFVGICRLSPLATFGEDLLNPWCADKASQCRALSTHGGLPDQAAL